MVEQRTSTPSTRVQFSSPARRRYGEGSIQDIGPNRWRIRWMVTDPVTGRSTQRSKTIHGTRRDAERALAEARNAVFSPTEMTVAQLVDTWLDAPTSKSARTRHNQRVLAGKHITPHVGHVRARALTPAQVTALYARLAEAGYSAQTIRHVHNILHAAFKLAVNMEWLERNPTTAAIKPEVARPPARPPHTDKLRAVLQHCDDELRCFAIIAALTGVRRGELCGLQWGDIDWDRRVMTIWRAVSEPPGGLEIRTPKTGRARAVDFDEIVQAAFAEQYSRHLARGFLGRSTDFVFASPHSEHGDRPISPHRMTNRWRRAQELAGVKIRFHDLRHWQASVQIAEGFSVVDVAARLGHSRPGTTLNIYGHLLESKGQRMASAASAALLGPRNVRDGVDNDVRDGVE